jgi:hypothetical protein
MTEEDHERTSEESISSPDETRDFATANQWLSMETVEGKNKDNG